MARMFGSPAMPTAMPAPTHLYATMAAMAASGRCFERSCAGKSSRKFDPPGGRILQIVGEE